MAKPPAPLPERAVLLHIGPHKTGTSAIQGALFEARPRLLSHGVLHAGKGLNPIFAVQAMAGKKQLPGDREPRMKDWEFLVAHVSGAEDQRVVVSSEFFADADPEAARRAVADLGGGRVHVVVTLRPLAKILPSQWQQYVQNRLTVDYERWLDGMLRKPPYTKPTPTFWHRHRHDELVQRWSSIVGAARTTVIVLDDSDPDFLLHSFEGLLGVPQGLLTHVDDRRNRSLTRGEIELIRLMNIEFKQQGWPSELYAQMVRLGIGLRMRTNRQPEPGEPSIYTPGWALELAAEIGAEAARRIAGMGVHVIGDLSALGAKPLATAATPQTDSLMATEVSVAAAHEALVGAIIASEVLNPAATVDGTSSRDLQLAVLRRVGLMVRRRVRRRWRKLRRAGASGG